MTHIQALWCASSCKRLMGGSPSVYRYLHESQSGCRGKVMRYCGYD